VSQYQKGKTNLGFTVARDSERQWHQLGHMQVCTSLQTDNHASNPPLSFSQAGCPSCRPTNSVKALKGYISVTSALIQHITAIQQDKKISNKCRCLPTEEESKQRTGKIQPLVTVMITIVDLATTKGGQQQTMHHVATACTQYQHISQSHYYYYYTR